MFTGIIEELGRVREIEKRGEDARIVIEARTVTEGSRNGTGYRSELLLEMLQCLSSLYQGNTLAR